jgi:restriction endonuclease S subunit
MWNLNIPIPPLPIQTEIVNYISKLRTQAQQLEIEAKNALAAAKRAVEKEILG